MDELIEVYAGLIAARRRGLDPRACGAAHRLHRENFNPQAAPSSTP